MMTMRDFSSFLPLGVNALRAPDAKEGYPYLTNLKNGKLGRASIGGNGCIFRPEIMK